MTVIKSSFEVTFARLMAPSFVFSESRLPQHGRSNLMHLNFVSKTIVLFKSLFSFLNASIFFMLSIKRSQTFHLSEADSSQSEANWSDPAKPRARNF